MKCIHCGFESEGYAFCPHCGRALPQEPASQPVEPVVGQPVENAGIAAAHILQVLKDPLFLAVCILLSVTSVVLLTAGSLPLLEILSTVFLWLAYAKSRSDVPDREQLRNLSGVAYANYILMHVLAVMAVVCGVLMLIASGMVESLVDIGAGNEFIYEFEAAAGMDLETVFPEALTDPAAFLVTFMAGAGIIAIVFAILVFVFNMTGMRKIHRFAKSVYQSLDADQVLFENAERAGSWLMIFGVWSAVSTLLSLGNGFTAAFIANGSSAAALIIASILVRRHFLPQAN